MDAIKLNYDNPLQRLRPLQVCNLLSMSKTTFYERVRQGKFPQPKKDGRMSYWTIGDIIDYENQKNADS